MNTTHVANEDQNPSCHTALPLLQTILGHGIDNHLLGLRETAVELGLPTPAIFADESYAMSIHFTVSTSQVKQRRKDTL